MPLVEDLKMQWRTGGMLVRLILINLGVFVGLWLIYGALFLFTRERSAALMALGGPVLEQLSVPSDLGQLARKPWTLLTSLFTHLEPGHIFWNMVMLWLGGRFYMDLLGGKRLLGTYLLSGTAGSALFILGMNIYDVGPEMPTAIGASGAVMGILVAIATYRPHALVHLILLGPVKLMYVAAVFVFLDLIGMGSGDRVAHEAHIGGALYGFLSAIQLKRGNDWSLRFVDLLDRLAAPFRRRKGPRLRVEKRPTGGVRPASSTAQQKQARIDAILDKISRSGYDSLSKEEKDLLFKASNDQ